MPIALVGPSTRPVFRRVQAYPSAVIAALVDDADVDQTGTQRRDLRPDEVNAIELLDRRDRRVVSTKTMLKTLYKGLDVLRRDLTEDESRWLLSFFWPEAEARLVLEGDQWTTDPALDILEERGRALQAELDERMDQLRRTNDKIRDLQAEAIECRNQVRVNEAYARSQEYWRSRDPPPDYCE